MNSSTHTKIFWVFFLFAFLYSAQVLPRLSADSLTNDEPVEITNGYYYLTHFDVLSPHLHPPLASALMALPLLLLHLKTFPFSGDVIDRSHLFMFVWNLDRLETITVLSRLVSWGFGLLIGFLLFRVTQKNFQLCLGTLFFWSLDPTLLGLAGLSKIEIIPTFFFFAAILIFQKSLGSFNARLGFLAGMVTAMAITSKLYTLTLFPIYGLLEWFDFKQNPHSNLKTVFKRWSMGLMGFIIFVFFLYLPALVFSPLHSRVPMSLMDKLMEDFVFAHHPYPVYFWGYAGLKSHWYYLPVAFLLKEPLPFLFCLILTLALILFRKIQLPPWQWVPAAVFFVVLLPTTNLGIRYLLPCYPFLFLIAAQGLLWLWEQRKQKTIFPGIWGGLLLWQTLSVGLQFPHDLSYFNEIVPPDQKLYYLADSNLDWGQDMKRLVAKAKQRHWGKVKLAYLGGINPRVYGLDWEPFQTADLKKPQPGTVYVVNASFYQLAPVAYPSTRNIVESWLDQTKPTGTVGDSWFYFEIPGKASTAQNAGPWLPSVPFLQYRGYCDYPLSHPEQSFSTVNGPVSPKTAGEAVP